MAAGTDSPVFDFTSLDFASVNDDLIRYAQSLFSAEKWSDFNANQTGSKLIRLMAYATDLVAYNANMWTLETITETLIREQSLRDIGKAFTYTLPSATPAKTTLTFTLDATFFPITIDKHYKAASSSGVVFQPDVTAAVSSTPYTVTATQGDEVLDELIGTSDGSTGQRFTLGSTPLIDGTLSIRVESVGYAFVDNAVAAGPLEAVYLLSTDENGVTTVIMGDGINGRIPPIGHEIFATYKVGGGDEGNLPPDTINSQLVDVPGVLSVTNSTTAYDGKSKQTVAEARRALPASIKANDRCVATEDYAPMAKKLVPGVLRCQGVAGVYGPGGPPIILFVVPNGGGNPTPALTNMILTALRPKKMSGKRVLVASPLYVDQLIDVTIFAKDTAPAQQLEQLVRARILSTFALTASAVDFGKAYSLQQYGYKLLDPAIIDGVKSVFFNRFTVLPYSSVHVNTTPTGNGVVEAITTTALTARREWLIRVSANAPVPTFTVYNRRLGAITEVTDQVVFDDNASYAAGALVGLQLHVREQEQATTFTITANTAQSMTVAGGLLDLAQPLDTYAVEFAETITGKILRTTVWAQSDAGTSILYVSSTGNWAVDDYILVRQSGNVQVSRVASIGSGQLVLSEALEVTFTVGATVDAYWKALDETVGFAVLQGSVPFVVGDEMYVDTYGVAEDITLRPEAIFSGLTDAYLTTRVVGGVK